MFAADSNGDGDTNDFAGSNQIGAERQADLTGFIGGNAILVSKEGDFASSGIYFRIQNNTGQTVFDWNFAADVFYEESTNSTSMFDFGYAIDNGPIPTTMSFTTIEAAATPTVGATYATLADSLNTTVSTAGVANGDYIVLGLRDLSASTNGSGIVVDNIGITASVTAVPEPSSLALLGMGLGGLVLRRRRRRKSSAPPKI